MEIYPYRNHQTSLLHPSDKIREDNKLHYLNDIETHLLHAHKTRLSDTIYQRHVENLIRKTNF